MTTTSTPLPSSAAETEAMMESPVARQIHEAAESLEDLATELSQLDGHPRQWQRLHGFLSEVKESARRGEVTPEELTGWAVSVTFAAVENRIRTIDPEVFFLVRSFGEACLLGARYCENRQSADEGDEALSEFNAAIDFVLAGVPEVELPQLTLWKQAA